MLPSFFDLLFHLLEAHFPFCSTNPIFISNNLPNGYKPNEIIAHIEIVKPLWSVYISLP
jgi:hypothetical protein